MVASHRYHSLFMNRHGDRWRFEYDASTGEGILRGSDFDWEPYRVSAAGPEGLTLNDEESKWLQEAWADARRRA